MEDEAQIVDAQSELHERAQKFDWLVGQCVLNRHCNYADAVLNGRRASVAHKTDIRGYFGTPASNYDKAFLIQQTIGFSVFSAAAFQARDASWFSQATDLIAANLSTKNAFDPNSLSQLSKLASAKENVADGAPLNAGIQSQLTKLASVAVQLSTAGAVPTPPAPKGAENPSSIPPDNGFVYYLRRLALTPLTSADFKAVFLSTDGKTTKVKAGTPSDQLNSATEMLDDWVFRKRLLPAVQEFCAISESHPLCVSGDEILGIANAVTLKAGTDPTIFNPSAPPPPRPLVIHPSWSCPGRGGGNNSPQIRCNPP